MRGTKLDEYDFGNVKLHDVAVLPDMSRIIGVGPLRESPTGLQPSKSRVEKRLVGRHQPFPSIVLLKLSVR